jgi:hypothetical protein
MATGSRIGWPERSNNLWVKAPRVASRALHKLARTSSDVVVLGWNDVNEVFYSSTSGESYLSARERWI